MFPHLLVSSGQCISELPYCFCVQSDTIAQKYIDHSKHIKQEGAETLSLRGLQEGEEGQVLSKRKSPCDMKVTAGPSAMSVNFYHCATVN